MINLGLIYAIPVFILVYYVILQLFVSSVIMDFFFKWVDVQDVTQHAKHVCRYRKMDAYHALVILSSYKVGVLDVLVLANSAIRIKIA